MRRPDDSVRIAPLEGAQVAIAVQLMERSFPADSGERWRPDDLMLTLTLTGVFGCLAFINEAPVGFAVTRIVLDEAELLLIGVVPEGRRQGAATRLLEATMETARVRSASTLFLEMRIGNSAARSLYTAAGFELVGVRKDYYRTAASSEDAITMRRLLRPS